MDDINKEWKIVDDKNKIGVVGGQVFRRNYSKAGGRTLINQSGP